MARQLVEETNLTVNISLLRKVLGNTPDGQPWIATIPKRGYRFDGAVKSYSAAPEAVTELSSSSSTPAAMDPTEPMSSSSTEKANFTHFEAENAISGRKPEPGARPLVNSSKIWIYAAAIVAILAFGTWICFRIFAARQSGNAASTVQTLAVLPFEPAGSNQDEQYLGVGLTDAVITRLGRLSQIVVRPIGAVRSLGKSPDPMAVGRQLNVQAVLDGTVKRNGDRTQVAVRLRRVSDGNLLWSEQFDEQNSSDFEIEDTISQRLAKALTLHLTADEQRQLGRPATPNSAAYEFYIQGRYEWNKRSAESVQKSIELFQQATKLDPNYAAAWSGLADAWILAGSYGNSFLAPSVAMPMAKDAADRALALDDSSPEAHTSLAYIHLTWDWDFAAAEREFKRALQINPGYVNAHHWYSHELVALKRMDESHEESELALGLDPTDVVVNEHMAWHHMMAREYDRSIPQANKAVELDPGFVQAHRVLALDLLYTGRGPEACAEFEKGVELSHEDPVANAYLARCYAATHREGEAKKLLAGLERAATERYVSAAEIAAVYAALNNPDEALKWLDKGCDERASSMIYLNVDRVWDGLRGNAKFQAVVKRVNLPLRSDESPAAGQN